MEILAMLVEADESLADLTCEVLRERGIEVIGVRDGEAALSEARSRDFDVIILDILLPRRDGFSVCRELRANSNVPIIVLTEPAAERDRIASLELGADDSLSKPYSLPELLARVRALVRRARGQVSRAATILRAGPLELRLGINDRDLRGQERRPHELRIQAPARAWRKREAESFRESKSCSSRTEAPKRLSNEPWMSASPGSARSSARMPGAHQSSARYAAPATCSRRKASNKTKPQRARLCSMSQIAAPARLRTPSLSKMRATWICTVRGEM